MNSVIDTFVGGELVDGSAIYTEAKLKCDITDTTGAVIFSKGTVVDAFWLDLNTFKYTVEVGEIVYRGTFDVQLTSGVAKQ